MRIQQFISTISNNREYFSYLKGECTYGAITGFFSGWVGFIGVREIIFFQRWGWRGFEPAYFRQFYFVNLISLKLPVHGDPDPPPFPSPLEDHRKQYKILTIIHELTLINQPLIFGGNC